MKYTGADAYAVYIDQAKRIYSEDMNANFLIWDMTTPPSFAEPFELLFVAMSFCISPF